MKKYFTVILCISFLTGLAQKKLRIGEKIVGADPISISPLEMVSQFSDNWRLFLSTYGMAGLYAILAWVLVAPFSGYIIFRILHPLFEKMRRQRSPL